MRATVTAHARTKSMRAKGAAHRARAKPMMERRTTAIPATHKEGEAAEEPAAKQATVHKQSTTTEQEGKNQDNHDEGQHCNALLSACVFFPQAFLLLLSRRFISFRRE